MNREAIPKVCFPPGFEQILVGLLEAGIDHPNIRSIVV
jgi:hypothetical protein